MVVLAKLSKLPAGSRAVCAELGEHAPCACAQLPLSTCSSDMRALYKSLFVPDSNNPGIMWPWLSEMHRWNQTNQYALADNTHCPAHSDPGGTLASHLEKRFDEGGASASTAVAGMIGLAREAGVRKKLASPALVRCAKSLATRGGKGSGDGVRANALGLLCNLR